MRNALFAVMGLLALSLVPVSGHAQMPGDKCGGDDQVVVGTTRMASDQQNIIACLKTGDTTPGANVSEWKAMTSGGGGGTTGACYFNGGFSQDSKGNVYYVADKWGQGCRSFDITYPPPRPARVGAYIKPVSGEGAYSFCASVAASGYECGTISSVAPYSEGGNGSWTCSCVKK